MWLIQSQCPFSKTVPTDDAEKSPIGYTVLIHSEQYLHNKKRIPNREHQYGTDQGPFDG